MNNMLSKEELRELYRNNFIQIYQNNDKKRIKRLVNYMDLKKNDKLIDIACGDGSLAKYITNDINTYNGIDFSSELIEYANRLNNLYSNVKYICEDIVSFCNNHLLFFDKACAIDFVEHIYDNDFIEIFTSVRKTLKNNGKLFIHTPNANFILERMKKCGILKQHTGHIAVRNANYYKMLLEQCGFKNIQVVFLPHYITILLFLHIFSYLPVIGEFFKARLLIICEK